MKKLALLFCILLCFPALISSAELPARKFLTADGVRPAGLFAPGVMVGKTVYIAGKGDYKPDEEIAGKVRNCLNEVRKTLQVAGLDLNSVVHTFCYLEDPDYYPEFNTVYGEFFPNNPPARTTVGVPSVPGDSRIEITCIAYADPAQVKPVGTPPAGFPFTPGVVAGDMLYISGKGDQLPEGGHPGTFEEQVRQCMKNVRATLTAARLDFRNAVMIHLFLDNPDNAAVAAKVYREFFRPGTEPALATVFVDWIPGGSHVEVTCWATTDLKSRRAVRPEGMKTLPGETLFPASPAVWAGNTLYLSEVSGFDNAAGALPDSLGSQVHGMARNDRDILSAAGLGFADIVSGHVYLRTIDDYAPMNAIYKEYYSAGPGVRTCLMPNSGIEKNTVKVRGSFIAAKTKKE